MASTVTGDIKNNIRKVQLCLRKVSYDKDIDTKSMIGGEPNEHMKIYHHLFADYSHGIAKLITDLGVELISKNDLRFMEGVYKVLREIFSYKPPITREQFFSTSFAERKIIMTTEIAELVYRKHRSMPQPGKSSTVGNLSSLKKSSSKSNIRMFDFDKTNASKLSEAAAAVDISMASVKRHNVSAHSYASARSNSGPNIRRDGTNPPTVPSTKRTSSGYADISPAEKACAGDFDVSAITCNLGSDSPDHDPRKIFINEETSYMFNDPIDIVAMTPQVRDNLGGNQSLTNKKRRDVLHCRDVRTDMDDVRLISSPVVSTELTEQDVRSMIAETLREQVESLVWTKFQPELDNLKARQLLLENKISMMSAAYENSVMEKGEGGAGNFSTKPETRFSQGILQGKLRSTGNNFTASPSSPVRNGLRPGNEQSPITVVGKEAKDAVHVLSPDVSAFEEKDKEAEEAESDLSNNNRSSTPHRQTSEEALQKAVTSLVDDVMGGAKMDMSDLDMNSGPSPTATQAERIYEMIRDTNAVMKNETY